MSARRRPLTYDDLLELARRYEGMKVETVTGKEFTVGIHRAALFFKPASSGWGQTEGRKGHERFLARYNETGSLRPSDYGDVSRNASYLIGVLRRAIEDGRLTPLNTPVASPSARRPRPRPPRAGQRR